MPVEAPPRARGWCEVRPEAAARFAELGLVTTRDFLDLPGVVVSGHVGRNVSRVELGDVVGYLKREHSVRWRDRWRNLLGGFGPVSVSRREWAILTHLDANDLPGPRWLACGEADGQAFLLLDEAEAAEDLRRTRITPARAAELGCIIARLHTAGIDQPDLFAKHFLLDPNTGRFTILDWQRARLTSPERVRRVCAARFNRIAALATFRASCPANVFGEVAWEALLDAYLSNFSDEDPGEFVRRVTITAKTRSAARAHAEPPAVPQELVRIGGERVCAIPAVASELHQSDVIDSLYDLANTGREFRFRNGVTAILRVNCYRSPLGRWLQAVRGKAWRSSELKTARLLFHLERHGIPGPKLLAYGQTVSRLADARAFVLAEPPDADPIRSADGPAVRSLLDRLHAAGCVLAGGPSPGRFGIRDGVAVVTDPAGFRLFRNPSRRQMARDAARLSALFRTAP